MSLVLAFVLVFVDGEVLPRRREMIVCDGFSFVIMICDHIICDQHFIIIRDHKICADDAIVISA